MRILGVDPGKKRVGLAISDPGETFSHPLRVIQRRNLEQVVEDIARTCRQEEVGSIVVGLPLNMDGSKGQSAIDAERMAALIGEATHLPIILHDERLSSVTAERSLLEAELSRAKRKARIDKVAAQVILQSYIDARRYEQRQAAAAAILSNQVNQHTDTGADTVSEKISIMPCLDMREGRVVKGVHFVDIKDAGDPVECARAYCAAGADELALLDITATVEGRGTLLDVVRRVSEVTTVPFTVGGGISDVATAAAVLEAGADKVSTSSAAFRRPQVIREMIDEFGPDCVTVAIDVDRNPQLPSGYEVFIDGGRTPTGSDAVEWARKVDGFGVRVILPTSKAGDGARTGYDLPVIRAMKEATSAKIVASGGAGELAHFYEAVEAGATVLLAASVFHYHTIDIGQLKDYLRQKGVKVS